MIRVHAEAVRNINTAAERMRKYPNLEYIIVLGAHVDGTRLTLALLERTRRALQYLEERSTSTTENLKFSLALIGLDHSVGVVTNNFHVFRGTAIGRKCGCKEIYPIPSKYCSWRLLIYIPREILAIIKDKIMGNL